jgi:glutaredoxin/Skp family chaperone for outer membrane proteins
MTLIVIVLLSFAVLLLLVGGVMVTCAAFRESRIWGWACVLLPSAKLFFIIRHWEDAKTGVLTFAAGFILLLAAIFAESEVGDTLSRDFKLPVIGHAAKETPAPANDYSAQIAEHRDRIERLEGQFAQQGGQLTQRYASLAAKRKTLKPGDLAAVGLFNTEAATYQKQNTEQKQVQQDLATARQELDGLLTERSRQRVRNAPGAADGKHVVMYCTATCPACQMAKRYFAQKGVSYEEKNVEQSRDAAAEFQRLGGHGVPLILVGEHRMDGFSASELDKLL